MIEDAKKGLVNKVEKNIFRKDETIPIIMEKLVPRYQQRSGGYTRILRNGYRASGTDRAPLAIVELVDSPSDTIHRLARVQLPTLKENLKKIQAEKYIINPVEVVDTETGEPVTLMKYDLRRGLDPRVIDKLSKQERGVQKLIAKYERSMKTYPIAREKDGVDMPTSATSGINQALNDLSLEPREVTSESMDQNSKVSDDKNSKNGWFKWF